MKLFAILLLCSSLSGICAQAGTSTQIGIFLIAGQSDAEGAAADPGGGPTVPPGQVLLYNGAISDANDPVGSALNGSAWPSFGLTYNRASGHLVGLVPAAVGGTVQCDAALPYLSSGSGSWDSRGTRWAESLTMLNAGLAAFTAAGYAPILKGVLWAQGEDDAAAISVSGGGYSAAQYQACLTAMIARYRAAMIGRTTYPQLPFYISKTGNPAGGMALPNFAGQMLAYSQIRDAQSTVAAADPYTTIAFSGAVDFAVNGMQPTTPLGNLHYSQAGYNAMGRAMAESILAGGEVKRTNHSPIILSANGAVAGPLPNGASYYLGAGLSSNEGTVIVPWAESGIFRNFIASVSAPPGAGNGIIATLKLSGAATPVTCEIVHPNTSCIDKINQAFDGASPSAIDVQLFYSSDAQRSVPSVTVGFDSPAL